MDRETGDWPPTKSQSSSAWGHPSRNAYGFVLRSLIWGAPAPQTPRLAAARTAANPGPAGDGLSYTERSRWPSFSFLVRR